MLLLYILLVILSFILMEFFAWFSHRYIMHGFLWKWHKDHHIKDGKYIDGKTEGFQFEKNDLFPIIFAFPAFFIMYIGSALSNKYLLSVGAGITLYGIAYFFVHDIIVHRRLKIPSYIMNKISRNSYMKLLIEAHLEHHSQEGKFKNFGFLFLFSNLFLRKLFWSKNKDGSRKEHRKENKENCEKNKM